MVKLNLTDIRFDGGRLCLNYVNSVRDRFAEPRVDYLLSIHDLIQWAFLIGIVDSGSKTLLESAVKEKTSEADIFYSSAITLRELIHRLFQSMIRNKSIKERDLNLFNKTLSYYFAKTELKQVDTNLSEGWRLPANSLYRITAPIVKDAHSLMLLSKRERIKECPNCGWLFYDISKNGRRRWCSMEDCGSKIKALNWYKRHKQK